ncbi:MAG: GNAT family N-acetyltransferase [Alphaproteobacteria bacterium]|jgi:GNAT superfamily N-acetyltransferase|nr:GNAT family N-acetyltransferase [Alphaproteobacteria bacterium]
MKVFQSQDIVDNFSDWVKSLAKLTDQNLHGGKDLCWYTAGLPHPMYSYGCHTSQGNDADLTSCITSFIQSQTPFYFCDGIRNEGKHSGKTIVALGADSFGTLDGMYFDLERDFPQVKPSIDVQIRQISTEAEYQDFAKATAQASDQPLEYARSFFSNFANLQNSPFILLNTYCDGKPVGCSMLYQSPGNVAGNYWDWVAPNYRKKGINSAMVVERLKIAKELGYKHLIAQCMDTSTRLYATLSFVKICELDFYGKAGYGG